MQLKSKKILGVDITVESKENILEYVRKYLIEAPSSKYQAQKKTVKPLVIYTPNPEIINYAVKNPDFKKAVNTAQISIPDGAGTVWALKKQYKMKIPKITGVDFMDDLCKMSSEYAVTTGLIGGGKGVALKTLKCLREKYPKLKGMVFEEIKMEVGSKKSEVGNKKNIKFNDNQKISGFDFNGKEISSEKYFAKLAKEILRKRIRILFVALGFPKQEYFINQLKLEIPLILMSVGGAFDYISGNTPRAPLWMRERGLEWLYRLIKEPWRIKRQLQGAGFFWRVMIESR
jgi:N-acetylglucosaminyldiphosphoundecaprenol N-acetyl-beta-D-mannosaminyltransferase